jgi:hypothetical protein
MELRDPRDFERTQRQFLDQLKTIRGKKDKISKKTIELYDKYAELEDGPIEMPYLFDVYPEDTKTYKDTSQCRALVQAKENVCRPIHNKPQSICDHVDGQTGGRNPDYNKTNTDMVRFLHDSGNRYIECSNIRQKLIPCDTEKNKEKLDRTPERFKAKVLDEQNEATRNHMERIKKERTLAGKCFRKEGNYVNIIKLQNHVHYLDEAQRKAADMVDSETRILQSKKPKKEQERELEELSQFMQDEEKKQREELLRKKMNKELQKKQELESLERKRQLRIDIGEQFESKEEDKVFDKDKEDAEKLEKLKLKLVTVKDQLKHNIQRFTIKQKSWTTKNNIVTSYNKIITDVFNPVNDIFFDSYFFIDEEAYLSNPNRIKMTEMMDYVTSKIELTYDSPASFCFDTYQYMLDHFFILLDHFYELITKIINFLKRNDEVAYQFFTDAQEQVNKLYRFTNTIDIQEQIEDITGEEFTFREGKDLLELWKKTKDPQRKKDIQKVYATYLSYKSKISHIIDLYNKRFSKYINGETVASIVKEEERKYQALLLAERLKEDDFHYFGKRKSKHPRNASKRSRKIKW